MELKDALRGRRSVRRYLPKSLPRELILEIIELAKTAPSAGNLRSRRYIVVTNPDLIHALGLASYAQSHVMEAPALIVVLADVPRSRVRYGDRGSLYAIQDSAAAVMCLLLAVHDAGLGSCWTGAFDDNLVRDILSTPEDVLPMAIISLGWPAESPSPPGGKQNEEIQWLE